MKVLILGAKGNLGQQLVKIFLLNKKNKVIAWDKYNLDITDKNEVNKKIVQLNPNLIINASAYNAVDACEESKEQFELAKKINGYAVGYIAKAAEKVGAVFIHYSTDYVFDGENKNGYKENDRPDPISNYGKSKLLGEKKILELSKINSKFCYYIIRTSKLFGPVGKSKMSKKTFFDMMFDLADHKKEIKVIDGEVSCFTYTKDLAQATYALVSNKNNKRNKGIYHIINSLSCAWYEAAKFLFSISKKNVKLIPVNSDEFPRPAKRPKYSVLLNTKLKPLRTYQEALKEYLKISV